MISGLQTRLLLTVGTLALAAVVAVALVGAAGHAPGVSRGSRSSTCARTRRARRRRVARVRTPARRALLRAASVDGAAARELAPGSGAAGGRRRRAGTLIASAGAPLASADRVDDLARGPHARRSTSRSAETAVASSSAFASRQTAPPLTPGRRHATRGCTSLPLPNPEREQRVDAILYVDGSSAGLGDRPRRRAGAGPDVGDRPKQRPAARRAARARHASWRAAGWARASSHEAAGKWWSSGATSTPWPTTSSASTSCGSSCCTTSRTSCARR